MGNVQASSIKNMIDLTNTAINNTVNSSSTEGTGKLINTQTFELTILGNADKCDLTNLQTITSDQKVYVSSTFTSSSEIKNELSNMIDQIASTSQDAVAEFLSLSGNAQLSSQELATSIKNDIQNNITNENTSICLAFTNNLQQGKFVINNITCGPRGTIENVQNIISKQEAECISNIFFNSISSNSIINDIVQKAETSQKAKTVGPIGALLGGLGGLIVLIVVGAIAFIIYKKYSGDKKSE